jgi:hypothetical protein
MYPNNYLMSSQRNVSSKSTGRGKQEESAVVPQIFWNQQRGNVEEVRQLMSERFPQQWRQAGDEIRQYMERRGIWGMDGRIEAERQASLKDGNETKHLAQVKKWMDAELMHMSEFLKVEELVEGNPRTREWPHISWPRNLSKRYARYDEQTVEADSTWRFESSNAWEHEKQRAALIHRFWYDDVRLAYASDLVIIAEEKEKHKGMESVPVKELKGLTTGDGTPVKDLGAFLKARKKQG